MRKHPHVNTFSGANQTVEIAAEATFPPTVAAGLTDINLGGFRSGLCRSCGGGSGTGLSLFHLVKLGPFFATTQVVISELVRFLRSELGRPVLEGTGLTAKYDFKLEWAPDESQPNSRGNVPPGDSEGPSIFSAMQEQLAKAESAEGPS